MKNKLAVLFALVFPSLVTFVYFVWAKDSASVQQFAFGVGKVMQFAFPAVWVFVVLREPFARQAVNRRGQAIGLSFGLAILAATLCLYVFVFKPMGLFNDTGPGSPGAMIKAKLSGFGVTAWWSYALFGTAYSLFHSFLEEYYWRWFVFKRMLPFSSLATAVTVSALGFMAHHVLVLAQFFGWNSGWTYLFSAAVAVGGAVWAWLYQRSQSLYAPWFSHALVDAAIFLVGYDLAF